MEKLKILIKGDIVNLCKPTLKFAKGDIWFKWLNNKIIVKNLHKNYKKLDNTRKKQTNFFLKENKKRLILIISTKNHNYKGVVSLSNFNKINRTCEIALITDSKIEPELAPYAGLESVALITEYAFKKLNIKTINGAGKISLKNWQQRMELFGYKFKNLTNSKKELIYNISCSYKDYRKIILKRKKLWDNLSSMKKRIKQLPVNSFQKKYLKLNTVDKELYYKKIFNS